MTRHSIMEYLATIRERYLRGTKEEKGKILDEFTRVTGRHRKATIRLLRRRDQPRANRNRGRPRQYGAAVVGALRLAWEATDRQVANIFDVPKPIIWLALKHFRLI